MATLSYGLVFSLALIVTAGDECRDRHEAIDFPLKYVTVPDNKPLDWIEASELCNFQHPGYDILERRYLWLSEQQKTPCKDHLVPLGLMKYDNSDGTVVVWQRLPPGLDRIRPTDLSKFREVKDLPHDEYNGVLNLTDGTWHWMHRHSPIFTCVICQHADNFSLIIDDYDRHPCFWSDSWIDKTVYQITLHYVAGGDFIDDYRIEEAVACAFNLTHDFVVILDDHEENRNEVMVHVALNGTVDTQQYLGRVLDGYKLTDILEVEKLKMCPEDIGQIDSHLGHHWPHVISGVDRIYYDTIFHMQCISIILPIMVQFIFYNTMA